jgi:hypothetical protein
VVEGGVVRICCRDCLRWHTVRIIQQRAVLEETDTTTLLANV